MIGILYQASFKHVEPSLQGLPVKISQTLLAIEHNNHSQPVSDNAWCGCRYEMVPRLDGPIHLPC